MGANGSKATAPQQRSSQYVFASDAPVRFSQDMIDALQTSGETDSTREKALEKVIQQRVSSELRELEQRESQRLRDLEEQIAPKSTSPSSASLPSLSSSSSAGPSRESLQSEIQALRQKLDGRKKIHDLDPQVKRARDDVVQCLRLNDRRPLDCWKEVENFKRQVQRLEEGFVERTL